MTYEEARKILDPLTTSDALEGIKNYNGLEGESAKIEAVNEACRVASKALKDNNGRPCLVFDDGIRKGIFRGFCDNNDKCVIEFENGELHKCFVYHIQFSDKEEALEDNFGIIDEIKGFIEDINMAEIATHIGNENLSGWIANWKNAILSEIEKLKKSLK